MRILITGGCGYIGCVLTKAALDAGHFVRVVDNMTYNDWPLETTLSRSDPALLGHLQVIVGDIRQPNRDWFEDIDVVCHLAGLSNDPTADFDPVQNWEVNALGALQMALLAKRNHVSHFIFASSASVYDGTPSTWPLTEKAMIYPLGYYSQAKYVAERAIMREHGSLFRVTILRQGTVYGWSPRLRFDLVVQTMLRSVHRDHKIVLHNPGTQRRPMVHVDDLARAYLAVIDDPDHTPAIYNVVEANYSIEEIARAVRSGYGGYPEIVREDPEPWRRQRDYAADGEVFRERFEWQPKAALGLHSVAPIRDAIQPEQYDDPRTENITWLKNLAEEATAT